MNSFLFPVVLGTMFTAEGPSNDLWWTVAIAVLAVVVGKLFPSLSPLLSRLTGGSQPAPAPPPTPQPIAPVIPTIPDPSQPAAGFGGSAFILLALQLLPYLLQLLAKKKAGIQLSEAEERTLANYQYLLAEK